jgi:probable F420-dependent oxidoreductase
MRIGAVFPQTEIGSDPAGIRAYAQGVEAMGFSHIVVYDHVLGADPSNRPGWRGYTASEMFHEPFVLYGYLAAITKRVELVTGVIILPQRQTVLVAKQAAELDVLSGGRLRLGIGVGWNPVEFEGLNEDFRTRGARSEEQIAVLRALWRDPVVTYSGKWHHIEAAGINPLPPRRHIPVWIGGSQEATLQRVARLGDGWMPQGRPDEAARASVERLYGYVAEAGRSRDAVGLEARLDARGVPEAEWRGFAVGWRELGAEYLGINTMGLGLSGPDAHLEKLRQVKAAVGE